MAGKVIDEVGNRYARLKVIEQAGYKGDHAAWRCICNCGKETVVPGYRLRNGSTRSCGCLMREYAASHMTKHGLSRSSEYMVWAAMKARCNRTDYVAHGITVCRRWKHSFEAFIEDMGFRPGAKYSIDRIDNDGNYTPENTRWATWEQQARNKRTSRWLTHNGKTQCLLDWAKETGMHYNTLYTRLSRGWSIERTLTLPVQNRGSRARKQL